MHDDPDDEYFLGDDADAEPADDRRNRRGALIGLAVVIVLVAVAITLTSLLVDTTPAARGPHTVAQRWSDSLASGDTAARRRLECATPADVGRALSRLLAGSGYRVAAGSARSQGKDRWSVPLRIESPDGSPITSVSVTVVRESGRYLVC